MFQALWRYKFIVLLAVTAGIWLAASASSRSYTTYESNVRLILDTPSSTLVKVGIEPGERDALERTINLAQTYAYLVDSGPVKQKLRSEFGTIRETIDVQSIQDSPIIEIAVSGRFPRRVERVTEAVATGFLEHITNRQNEHEIAAGDRITVSLIGSPSSALPLKSRKTETMALMFLGPVLLGGLVVVVLENLRGGRVLESVPAAPGLVESEVD